MSCCGRHLVTVDFKNAPHFSLSNPYIISGYRKQLSLFEAISSLFTLHNETVNVWTHLVPALIYAFWVPYTLASLYDAPTIDRNIFLVGGFCSWLMFMSSSFYHLFKCMSSRAVEVLLHLDFTGIILIQTGLRLAGTHLLFHCVPTTAMVFNTALVLLATLVLLLTIIPPFCPSLQPVYHRCHGPAMAIFGISAVLPWIYGFIYVVPPIAAIYPDYAELTAELMFDFSWYVVGYVIWHLQIPERWWLGTFDIWLSSHQIWHLAVVMGTVTMNLTFKKMILFNQAMQCPASLLDLGHGIGNETCINSTTMPL